MRWASAAGAAGGRGPPGRARRAATGAATAGARVPRAREDLRFDWWFAELADAARNSLAQAVGSEEWRPPFWLLHGLAAIAPPALVPTLPSRGFVKSLRAEPAPPLWLSDATRIAATSEV